MSTSPLSTAATLAPVFALGLLIGVVWMPFMASTVAVAAAFEEEFSGQEMFLFAEDHYKAAGAPIIRATPVDPVIGQGQKAELRIVVANEGRVLGLVPVNVVKGREDVAAKEREEELRSVDALNLVAVLSSKGALAVSTGPQHINELEAGSAVPLDFELEVGEGASGPQELTLELEYEHQVDVSVGEGDVTPLYLPDKAVQTIYLDIREPPSPFRVEETRSGLLPGENGTVLFVVRNLGYETAQNCTARLKGAPPFSTQGEAMRLGDISPGGLAVAKFWTEVEEGASPGEYQLACEIEHAGGTATIPVPATVKDKGLPLYLGALLLISIGVLAVLGLGLLAATRKNSRQSLRRSRWNFR